MNRTKVIDYLRGPFYLASLAALPFIVGYGRIAVDRWTTTPLERCLKGGVPPEFSDEDQRALVSMRAAHSDASDRLMHRHAKEFSTLVVRLEDAQPETQNALLDVVTAQHLNETESFYNRSLRAIEKLCHEAADRGAKP